MNKAQEFATCEELIEKIIDAVTDNFLVKISNVNRSGAKRAVHKLLQLEVDLRVTRTEIRLLVLDIQNCHVHRPCSLCIDSIEDLFKSHGFKVEEK